jgi:uncharacterized protein YwqG
VLTPDSDSPLAQAARQYLTAEDAAAWIGLLRPAFHLREYVAGEPVVGYLGGSPLLPEELEWPTWDGHGPLSFIGAIDCGALPAKDLDIPLPEDGALLFFYFDGQIDDSAEELDDWTPATDTEKATLGARVLYVPAFDHPAFRAAFGDPYDPASPHSALAGDDFDAAVDEVREGRSPNHQIAGYTSPVQGSVENEAARAAYPVKDEQALAARAALAEQLVLLAQIDSDDSNEMSWGDAGALFWLIRREDLAAGRFDAALFTWQSH